MREHRRRWSFGAALLGLALLGPAAPTDAVTLDTEGAPLPPTLCPSVEVTTALASSQTGGNRVYEFKGTCWVPASPIPKVVSVTAQASTKLDGTGFQDATEKITVTGGVEGTILTKTEKCTKDPFVHGPQVCNGPRAISTSLSAIWFQEAPLLAGRVPANQVYAPLGSGSAPKPPAPKGLGGQVVIVTPTEGQVFLTGSGSVLVEFKPAWPDEPPKGSVKLQWQRRSSRGGWEAHSAVSHVESYKQSHGIPIPTFFPQPGNYRLRATSRPDGWTDWREFHIASVAEVLLEMKGLAQRLERHPRDPDAARVLVEVRGLQTRLGSQPRDLDLILPRLNELKREVRQIEVVPRRLTPPRPTRPAPASKSP
jgi:hypothetical protein